MPFNIDTFRQTYIDQGYLKLSHFQVSLRPPSIIRNSNFVNSSFNQVNGIMRFRTESVKLPGITILTSDNNKYGVGPTQKFPHSANFNENSLSIVCDREGNIWNFWYEWARSIFQFNGTDNAVPGYYAEYKDNYSTTIQVQTFNQEGDIVQTINMFEAFPTSVQDIPLNWGNGEIVKLTAGVTFASYSVI